MVSSMGSFLFSLFLTLSNCSANARTPMVPVVASNEVVDPYMLGVCEGIASISMTVTDMQLRRHEKNLMVFSIATDQDLRQDFYCHQCLGQTPEEELIVLTSTVDAQQACSEDHP
jgi:hypothetical protein